MGYRIMTFHGQERLDGKTRLGETYYAEADYTPVAVRISAGRAPVSDDALIDIFDDKTSIFADRASTTHNIITGVYTRPTPITGGVLPKGMEGEEHAEDFALDSDDTALTIVKGSWVHCEMLHTGGGENFTVSLELHSGDEDLTEEE